MKNFSNWKLVERKANDNGYKGTKNITKEESIEIIESLNDFNINDQAIYRGIDLPYDFYIVDPKQDRREYVVGTMPTLIMEYHKSWEKFPSRMESLFITNEYDEYMTYGKIFRVIPFDDASFGVSSTYNYKESFSNIKKAGMTATNFFYAIKDYFNYIGSGYFTIPETTEEKKNYINKENYDYCLMQLDEMLMNTDCQDEKFCRFDDADDLVNYYFNADDNGFKIKQYKDLLNEIKTSTKEIWTDSKCLLISDDVYNKIFNI